MYTDRKLIVGMEKDSYVKSLVYADKPQTLDPLEDNIRRVIADIRPQMLEKIIENWTSRLDYIRASRGSPMPEILFEMNKNDHRHNPLKTPSAENAISTPKLFAFPRYNTHHRPHAAVYLGRVD
ncbi:hypothetical protein TNCV_186131 [Trichonephila clavipes]|nr:hypothetical protein TNCV_186131 [Trichonephila clavipes]